MKNIRHYIFDLYGTLVDIHTDEESPMLWEQMAAWYGAFGVHTTGEEMKRDFRRLEAEEVQRMIREAETIREEILETGTKTDAADEEVTNEESNKIPAVDMPENTDPEIDIENVFLALFLNRGVEADRYLAKTAGRLFRKLSTEYIRLYPGAKELLAALAEHGSVWLLSNAQVIFTQPELERLGLVPYFRGIYLSSAYGVKKPDPAFFRILLDGQGIRPEEAVMIGNDGACDIGGACRVGMHTAYLHSNISPDEPMPDADVVLERMDLPELQRRLLDGR